MLIPKESDRIIFLHGLLSSGQGFKGRLFRSFFPNMLTPDFPGTLEERMSRLYAILGDSEGWCIIGSSFGGLMATLFATQRPQQVKKLILLAPAIAAFPADELQPPPLAGSVSVPVTIYHGIHDDVVPLEPVRRVAEELFTDLTFHVVEDGHRLHETVQAIDWPGLVG